MALIPGVTGAIATQVILAAARCGDAATSAQKSDEVFQSCGADQKYKSQSAKIAADAAALKKAADEFLTAILSG